MLVRLLERGKTSGRDDDNSESIKKRFRKAFIRSHDLHFARVADLKGTFIETSMPVVDHYRKQGKVVEVSSIMCSAFTPADPVQVDSSPSVDVVYDHVRASIDTRLPSSGQRPTVPLNDATAPQANAHAL